MQVRQPPFGLQRGLRACDINDCTQSDEYQFVLGQVPRPHPEFIRYQGDITPQSGLFQIIAMTENISCGPYGNAALIKYEEIIKQLQLAYGLGQDESVVPQDEFMADPENWAFSLHKGVRMCSWSWQSSKMNLPNNIENIFLSISPVEYEIVIIGLGYQFDNFSAARREIDIVRSSVF